MHALITEADVNYLQSCCPLLEIEMPTSQQQNLLLLYFRGMSLKDAAQEVGYKNARPANVYIESEAGTAMLKMLRDREFTDVRITRESLTGMFMECYHFAATAAEKIAATRELGKLHDLYPNESKRTSISITQNNIGDLNAKTVVGMTDAQLAALVGPEMSALLNPPSPRKRDDADETVIEDEIAEEIEEDMGPIVNVPLKGETDVVVASVFKREKEVIVNPPLGFYDNE